MSTHHPIRAYRLRSGLTLEQFAQKFGVNKSTALRWEGGQVPAERVLAIAELTGIPPRHIRPDLFGTTKLREREAS